MDEDKISSDISDKRKVEDDQINPKPNPKRIKLVRPVFSPVTKPTISSTPDIIKIDLQPTETPRSSNLNDKVLNVPDLSLPFVKSNNQQETTKKPHDQQEPVKKSVNATLVPEEQVDSTSGAIDIQNIFSEETKKELEHLKKNIFKIEDDGSSSENDSQSKRPRLKRPTFVKKIFDKTNEVTKLDSTKSACEETINKIYVDGKVDKVAENNTEIIKVNEVYENVIDNNIVEKKSVTMENITKVAEEKLTTSMIDLVEKPLNETKETTKVEKLYQITDKEIQIEKGSTEIKPDFTDIEHDATEIKLVDTVIKHDKTDITKGDTDILCETEIKKDYIEIRQVVTGTMQKVVKEDPSVLFGNKSIDKDSKIAEEQTIQKQELIEKNIILQKENNESVNKNSVVSKCTKNIPKVVLDHFDLKNYHKSKNEKLILSMTLKAEGEENSTTVQTNNEECTEKYNKNNKKVETDTIKDIQVIKMVGNLNDNEFISLGNENQKSKRNIIEDENKCSDISPNKITNLDLNQKLDENESQIFKSDILKAALMSKKSSESLADSLETHDQLDTNDHPLDTKKTEILPKIGQEAIVNKIEAEIKLATKDQLANNKKSHNKTFNSVPDINYPKISSSPISVKEIIEVDKYDEPPKWGSAKMNEVEKFLNDSNVTITPICKSQESPKLGKITLKLPKVGNPEIKSETTVSLDVKSELIKKITNKHIAMGDGSLKSTLSQPSKSFSDFATIRPAPKPSAEQIALLEQQILNTPRKRGRPSKALARQKQLLLQYQQEKQQKVQEDGIEDEQGFHVPLFDMEDMSGGTGIFDSFDASTPKKVKSIRGKSSRGGRRGRGGCIRGRDESDSDTSSSRRLDDELEICAEEIMNAQDEETKQVAMIEAERLRKEEERERKLEARKKKLKERNDLLKEKKMKKKLKAEERRLQWHEKKRRMQEEKARVAEMKKSLPPPQNFDDETRMSADCNNSRSQTPARNFMIGMFMSCKT